MAIAMLMTMLSTSTPVVVACLCGTTPAWAQVSPADPEDPIKLSEQGNAFYKQGKYAQAEPLYKRALAIREKALGPDHPDVASILNNLAETYFDLGQYARAESLYNRSLVIREKVLGPDHPDVAQSFSNLAYLHGALGRYERAELLYKRSQAIFEKALGSDHPNVAANLDRVAELYRSQNKYAEAEPFFKRSLVIYEKVFGSDHPDVGTSLNNLAGLYNDLGQYAQAEPLFKRSLAIYEKALPPDHPDLATSINNLARLYAIQGHYSQAEPLYKRSLAIFEKALGPNHLNVAKSINNLALIYRTLGRYDQAGPLYKRSLEIYEKALPPDHPDLATSINNLASLYDAQGHYSQAEPLYKRALAIRQKALGPDHPAVALVLNNLAGLSHDQGQYAQAEPLYRRALTIREKSLGPDHSDVARSLNNLAALYEAQGQYAQAEPHYKRALAIFETALGPDHPDVASSLNNLAVLYDNQGQYLQSEPLYQRSLSIREKALGLDHPNVAQSLNNLASAYADQSQAARALLLSRRASSIYRQRIVAGGADDTAIREALQNRSGFQRHLSLLANNPNQEPIDRITDESFQIVQLEQATGTAGAIAKMAARFAKGDDALAELVKRRQDAAEQRSRREAQLVTASSKLPQERNAAAEQQIRDDIAQAAKDIDGIDAELTQRFPEYQELTRPEPMPVDQIRTLLKPGEAMIVYALGKESFLWVVKPTGAVFLPLAVDAKDVAAKVAAVRAQMEVDDDDRTKRVSVDILHELYQRLFAPALPHLDGVKHIMVVPAGPLQSLPFGMLVASPAPETKTDADYQRVDWLIKRYAFSVLPSVSSIQAFRRFAKDGVAQEPFAGFGDPLIGDTDSGTRGKRAKANIAGVFRNVGPKAKGTAATTEIADVEAIRSAARLPETAGEIRAIAGVLKGKPDSIWLKEKATETRVKALDLSRYRTIAFATHGLMAGEIDGVGEAGLILTPPAQGTLEDDGYLSAGEIAKLKLNADWVILSACNTAAADGTPGAEGLSGLAKAFFYAGARSLLVSHWPVWSAATVPLTTEMLRAYQADPAQGKAEAHRKAVLALMKIPKHPEYAHPIYWAPFVVVGEGGGAKSAPVLQGR